MFLSARGYSLCTCPWNQRVSEEVQPDRIGTWGRKAPRICRVCKGHSGHLEGCAGPVAVPWKQPRRHRNSFSCAQWNPYIEHYFNLVMHVIKNQVLFSLLRDKTTALL